jgi:hypothetical protein
VLEQVALEDGDPVPDDVPLLLCCCEGDDEADRLCEEVAEALPDCVCEVVID